MTTTRAELAALIAAERSAADRYRKANAAIYRTLWTYGVESDQYRAGAEEEEQAVHQLVAAQADVDAALRALSEVRAEVTA